MSEADIFTFAKGGEFRPDPDLIAADHISGSSDGRGIYLKLVEGIAAGAQIENHGEDRNSSVQ